jgi:hypothetical protein
VQFPQHLDLLVVEDLLVVWVKRGLLVVLVQFPQHLDLLAVEDLLVVLAQLDHKVLLEQWVLLEFADILVVLGLLVAVD